VSVTLQLVPDAHQDDIEGATREAPGELRNHGMGSLRTSTVTGAKDEHPHVVSRDSLVWVIMVVVQQDAALPGDERTPHNRCGSRRRTGGRRSKTRSG